MLMTRKVLLFELLMIAAAVMATAMLYPHLSNEIATHWNTSLQPDGYSPKWSSFLLGPGMLGALTLFTYLGPWLSPRKFEVENFQSTYNLMMLVLFCAWAYCTGILLWAGSGHRIDAGRAIQGCVCVLFTVLGNIMGKVRRNFFLGIKTPWALASERVWNATHRLAAKTFVASGLIGLLLTILDIRVWPAYLLLAGALTPAIYSFTLYKQLQRKGQL